MLQNQVPKQETGEVREMKTSEEREGNRNINMDASSIHKDLNSHSQTYIPPWNLVIYLRFVLQNLFSLSDSRLFLLWQRSRGTIFKKKSAERRKMKRYSQVFVILIDIMQLQNVRVLY